MLTLVLPLLFAWSASAEPALPSAEGGGAPSAVGPATAADDEPVPFERPSLVPS